MNKGQGATFGAIVLAGLLVHPLSTLTPAASSPIDAGTAGAGAAGATSAVTGEGPWIASCKYWAPSRPSEDQEASPPETSFDLKITSTQFDSHVTGSTDAAAACQGSKDPWGIPAASVALKPDITAIIAAVPDPLHAHIALEFDRTIDALLQAAADNGYVESYYWLPWKAPGVVGKGSEVSTETEEEHARESQPGLIVLKYVPQDLSNSSKIWSSYNRVIYLFLVGDTPVLGMNGYQLQNAFRYEGELQQKGEEGSIDFRLSIAKKGGTDARGDLAVIGSDASGSAASLRAGLERAWLERDNPKKLQFNRVDIAGGTSTPIASDILNLPFRADGTDVPFVADLLNLFVWEDGTCAPFVSDIATMSFQGDRTEAPICYISFGHNSTFESDKFLRSVECSGHNTGRVAFLVEDGTVFGESKSTKYHESKTQPAEAAPRRGSPAKKESISEEDSCEEDKLSTSTTYKPPQPPITIRFPRGISLLRNAHKEEQSQHASDPNTAPSPYLHLSLQDSSVEDTVSHFSTEHTPLSQEAQLMEIARQLGRYRAQFIGIFATDVLDKIFLAQFLHRALPDARLVSMGGGDLLFEHGTDNVPFIGALTITPYSLVAPVSSSTEDGLPQRPFASSDAEGAYNAASYTFWDGQEQPRLANYRSIFDPDADMHASLWITAIGRDGYYPVGILNECASDSASILPALDGRGKPAACNQPIPKLKQRSGRKTRFPVSPSLLWLGLCGLIFGVCIFHIVCLRFASFWSPFTRDLAIDQNDEPSRRALYIHIGTVMLFCLAFVVAYPIFPALRILRPHSSSLCMAIFTLLAATAALIYSFIKTAHYALRSRAEDPEGSRLVAIAEATFSFIKTRLHALRRQAPMPTLKGVRAPFSWRSTDAYLLFHGVAFGAMILIPLLWIWICGAGASGRSPSRVGLFFSYRCLNPASGVSPLVPVLLLLFSWYLWSTFQTRRLRFSETSRPRLPGRIDSNQRYHLFVSDEELGACETPTRPALYHNITCLLITQQILRRFFPRSGWKVPAILMTAYLGLFLLCVFGIHVEALDTILWKTSYRLPTPYEFLVEVLFFPLLMIGLSGWLRMVLIWGGLRRGLLKPLEERPIRFAFGRLSKAGWMSIMKQSDLHERRREMARSTESMRQMANNDELKRAFAAVGVPDPDGPIAMSYQVLTSHIEQLLARSQGDDVPRVHVPATVNLRFLCQEDIPDHYSELLGAYLIENDYAEFSTRLLERVLVPYWRDKSCGFVEGEEVQALPVHARRVPQEAEQANELALHAGPAEEEPTHIRLAEEFVAIRYVSLIRAVLVNVRHLMTFVTCAFVLSIVAWNSYPFQPREWIDAVFTILLLCMGSGIVWVLAQIHRDPILSRLTRTRANELGVDFYLRIATFGGIPVLTWLAYQFPSIGNTILTYLQPSLQVVK